MSLLLLLVIATATLALTWWHGGEMYELGCKMGRAQMEAEALERVKQAQEQAVRAYEESRPTVESEARPRLRLVKGDRI